MRHNIMIRRMVEENGSLPRRGDGKDELNMSSSIISNGKSFDTKSEMDRSIHSIEEGENEEDERRTTADYSVLQAIPPFRGNNMQQQKSSSSSLDDSSHSASSLGCQSNFIQQRINKHKKKGDWNTALDDSISSSDDDDDDGDEKKMDAGDTATKYNECADSFNNKQPLKATMSRTPSLVSLLKMEPICEKKVLRNDLDYNYDDEDDYDEDNNGTRNVTDSFNSEMSGISGDDAGFEIGDVDSTPDHQQQQQQQIDRETSRRPSFLPNIDTERRFVEVEITPMVDVSKAVTTHDRDDSSDTFLFTSIHSTDDMTHASDAPDYDYNSEHGEKKNSSRYSTTEEESGISSSPARTTSYRQKFIPPMERRKVTQARAQKTERDEVCKVLGLPKDKPRKIQRGIMSRNTELRLRTFLGDESDPSSEQVQSSSSKFAANNNKGIDSSSVGSNDSSSEAGSGDSSMDLAFGDSPEKASNENDKWERVRLARRLSRQSMTSSAAASNATTSAQAIGTSGKQAKENNNTEESSWHNSFNWIKKPLYSVDNDDDEDETKSVKTKASLIGKIYSRFQRPQNEAADHESSSSASSDSDSHSTDDSSDDEDDTWDMNVLTEGQYYLSMSMLVYVYGLLRQTSLLGHTEIPFDEVDVNSSQSESRMGKSHRYLNNTKSAGFIIRVVMDELEKKGAFSSIEKEGDVSVLREFKQWVLDSRRDQLDSATVDTIRELRRRVARKRWKRAIHAVRLAIRLGKGNKNIDMKLVAQQSFRRNRRSSMDLLKENMKDGLQNIKSAGTRAARGSRALASSMVWMHDRRSQIMSGLGLSDDKEDTVVTENSLVDEGEIRDIVNDALEQPRFFKEGSLMSNLIESSIEVVWFSDRHPNDVVYSICCNRRQKRVSVVFRGTVNSHNWLMNLKFFMTKHPNPIAENYPGREETLGFHTGYSLYMTRQRRDDSLTKIEEIFSKIDSVGRELAPDGDYDLSITGHSLGGALATILSFFAATHHMFSKVKTIRVFTFAAPRVGCYGFARAFQHLERKGKIRMARFSNTRDLIPLIPFHGLDGMGRSYKHVGMHIRLLGMSKVSQYWLRQALDVTYPKDDRWWPLVKRSFWASLIMNLNSPAGYKRMHNLSEHQKRIHFSLEFRNALAKTDLLHDKKRARLKTLDEYYFIRGGTSLAGTKELTAITLEENAKLADRRRMKKIVFGLLVIAIAEALLLMSFLNVSIQKIQCESLPMILYPFYSLIGCQKQGVYIYGNSSLKASKDLTPQTEVLNPMPSMHEKKWKQTVKAKSESKPLSVRWPRVLWFGKKQAVFPTLSETPCFWGHCNISPQSQSRLPWGVRLEHLPMPSDFEYQLSQVSQELESVSEQLKSIAHSFVCESVDIQSNISDTALKKLKAAENKLQAVEYYEMTINDNTDLLTNGLKCAVRFVIDFLESLLIL